MMIYWFTLVFVMFKTSDFFLNATNWRLEVSTKNKHLDFFLIN